METISSGWAKRPSATRAFRVSSSAQSVETSVRKGPGEMTFTRTPSRAYSWANAAEAVFSAAFANVALSGDYGGSYFLSKLVGTGRARELYYLGAPIDADEALRIGLVLEVVEGERLMDAVDQVAQNILRNTPLGVELTKQVLQLNIDAPSLEAAVELEKRTNIVTTFTEDRDEAIAAFKEKRPPTYRHR